MKKYLLVFIAMLLTAAVVTATVLNSNKKASTKSTKDCPVKKTGCQKMFSVACY